VAGGNGHELDGMGGIQGRRCDWTYGKLLVFIYRLGLEWQGTLGRW
jgi:hypothetical protein